MTSARFYHCPAVAGVRCEMYFLVRPGTACFLRAISITTALHEVRYDSFFSIPKDARAITEQDFMQQLTRVLEKIMCTVAVPADHEAGSPFNPSFYTELEAMFGTQG